VDRNTINALRLKEASPSPSVAARQLASQSSCYYYYTWSPIFGRAWTRPTRPVPPGLCLGGDNYFYITAYMYSYYPQAADCAVLEQ